MSKKLLWVALAATTLVGCSDEAFIEEAGKVSNDLNGKLVKAGYVAGGKIDESSTRGFASNGYGVWMPEVDVNGKVVRKDENGAIVTTGGEKQYIKIGLCWTGRNNKNEDFGALSTVKESVFTNYMFYHVGWLDKEASKVEYEPCAPYNVTTGAFIKGEGNPEANFASNESGVDNKYYYTKDATEPVWYGEYTRLASAPATMSGKTQLNKGIFKTDNAMVYAGEYLVYFPYTSEFKKGPIVARNADTLTIDATDGKYKSVNEKSFGIGLIQNYEGGNGASTFTAKYVSGFYNIRFKNSNLSAAKSATIKQVILYSPEVDIITSTQLDANYFVGKLDPDHGSALEREGGYLDKNQTKASTIVVNLNTTTDNAGTKTTKPGVEFSVPANTSTAYNGPKDGDKRYVNINIPVLAQKIDDLKVLLVSEDDQIWDVTPLTAAQKEINPGAATTLVVDLDKKNFQKKYMVANEDALIKALTSIYEISDPAIDDDDNNYEVTLLNDIEMTKDLRLCFNRNITINSKTKTPRKLILTSKQNGNATEISVYSHLADRTLTVDVDVDVQGHGCCSWDAAKLNVGVDGGSTSGTVKFNKKITNNGTIVLGNMADSKTDALTIEVNELVNWAETGTPKTNEGVLYLSAKNADNVIKITTLVNNNEVATLTQDVKFPSTHQADKGMRPAADAWTPTSTAQDKPVVVEIATETALDRRLNYVTIGTLTNNKNVTINNYTSVVVETALTNAEDAKILVKGGVDTNAKSGFLRTDGTASNEGIIDNTGNSNFNGSALQNSGLFVDRQTAHLGGYGVDNEPGTNLDGIVYEGVNYNTDLAHGITVARVDNQSRFNTCLNDEYLYASFNIMEIVASVEEKGYQLPAGKNEALKTKDVYTNRAGGTANSDYISFHNIEVPADGVEEIKYYVAHCLTVVSGYTYFWNSRTDKNTYYVDKDVKVLAGATLENNGLANIGGNVTVNGTFESSKHPAGTCTPYYKIGGDVTVGDGLKANSGRMITESVQNYVTGDYSIVKGGYAEFAEKTRTDITGEFNLDEDGKIVIKGVTSENRARVYAKKGDVNPTNSNNPGGLPWWTE